MASQQPVHGYFPINNPPGSEDPQLSRTVVGIVIKGLVNFLVVLAVLRYLPVKKGGETRRSPFGEDAVTALVVAVIIAVVDYFDPEIMKFAQKLCGQVMDTKSTSATTPMFAPAGFAPQ